MSTPARAVAILIAAATVAVAAGACSSDKFPPPKRLNVAFKTDLPGLSYQDPGSKQYTGFEPTMTKRLLDSLGYTFAPIAINQSDWQSELTGGQVDLVISAISDREPKDAPGISFARAYLQSDMGALTPASANVDIATERDLAQHDVCTVDGTTARAEIDARKTDWHINSVEAHTTDECLKRLADDNNAVYVSDWLILDSLAQESKTNDGTLLALSSGHFGKYQYYSIAMKAGSQLCGQLVNALKTYVGSDDWVSDLTSNLKFTDTMSQIKHQFSTLDVIDDKHCYSG